MSDSSEQSQLREHLSDIKRAIHGLGKDLTIEIQNLDRRIGQLSERTAREAEQAGSGIRRDISKLGKTIDEEASRIPGRVSYVGQRIGTEAKKTAGATAETVAQTARKAKEGTQTLFARAAGVKKTPMKAWSAPPDDDDAKKR